MELRAVCMARFPELVGASGLLDRFALTGIVASWWGELQPDIKTVAARGLLGWSMRGCPASRWRWTMKTAKKTRSITSW